MPDYGLTVDTSASLWPEASPPPGTLKVFLSLNTVKDHYPHVIRRSQPSGSPHNGKVDSVCIEQLSLPPFDTSNAQSCRSRSLASCDTCGVIKPHRVLFRQQRTGTYLYIARNPKPKLLIACDIKAAPGLQALSGPASKARRQTVSRWPYKPAVRYPHVLRIWNGL